MDELISRQTAIDAVCKCTEYYIGNLPTMINKTDAYKALADLPAADAVPVVRCKDCAHNNLPPTAGNALCSIYYGMTDVYGFCHKGERRTDE